MAANLPSGTTLKVKHNGNDNLALGYPVGQENTGWDDLGPDELKQWRVFKTNRTGGVDVKMSFYNDVTLLIYENDSETPARIKKLFRAQ